MDVTCYSNIYTIHILANKYLSFNMKILNDVSFILYYKMHLISLK